MNIYKFKENMLQFYSIGGRITDCFMNPAGKNLIKINLINCCRPKLVFC